MVGSEMRNPAASKKTPFGTMVKQANKCKILSKNETQTQIARYVLSSLSNCLSFYLKFDRSIVSRVEGIKEIVCVHAGICN